MAKKSKKSKAPKQNASAAGINAEQVDKSEENPVEPDGPAKVAEDTPVGEAGGAPEGEGAETEDAGAETGAEREPELKQLSTCDDDVEELKRELAESEAKREKIQVQYDALLGRIGSMKSLFTKMKENELELEETKDQLDTYEKQNLQLRQKVESVVKEKQECEHTLKLLQEESQSLNSECDRLSSDLSQLRKENEDKDSTYSQERQELLTSSQKLQRELDMLKQSNEEYIITIENDKIVNSSLNMEITNLQDRLKETEHSVKTMEQEKLHEQQQKDTIQAQLDKLVNDTSVSQQKHLDSFTALEQELESQRAQFVSLKTESSKHKEDSEKLVQVTLELKEKQLQIGKLRHEAVILNEHLTKALQLIKRSSDSETVDKELVTNLFISFVTIPRGDSKKFEVLQLIANFLGWGEDQKLQAGLTHHGTGGKSRERESFVSLWTEYLEKESTK